MGFVKLIELGIGLFPVVIILLYLKKNFFSLVFLTRGLCISLFITIFIYLGTIFLDRIFPQHMFNSLYMTFLGIVLYWGLIYRFIIRKKQKFIWKNALPFAIGINIPILVFLPLHPYGFPTKIYNVIYNTFLDNINFAFPNTLFLWVFQISLVFLITILIILFNITMVLFLGYIILTLGQRWGVKCVILLISIWCIHPLLYVLQIYFQILIGPIIDGIIILPCGIVGYFGIKYFKSKFEGIKEKMELKN